MGALVYSTGIYFAIEVATADATGADLPMVFLVNAPWTLVPLGLMSELSSAAAAAPRVKVD